MRFKIMQAKQIFYQRRGMTLVEVMAALALLVIVFTGFVTMVSASSQMNRKAEELRDRYEQQLADITLGQNLKHGSDILTLKVAGDAGSKNIQVNILVKTAEGSDALAIFEEN